MPTNTISIENLEIMRSKIYRLRGFLLYNVKKKACIFKTEAHKKSNIFVDQHSSLCSFFLKMMHLLGSRDCDFNLIK